MPGILTDFPLAGVKRITFDNPDKLNAFTFDMYEQYVDVLNQTAREVDTRVVIVTGSGSRGFCSGHDLSAGGKPGWVNNPDELGRAYANKYVMAKISSLPLVMRGLPQPIIAAINGTAAGMGMAIALAADICVAAQTAKFVNSIHNANTGHELGLSYTLPRIVGSQRAAEMLYTARAVPADEAERIGLVLRTVPNEQLMDNVLELAKSIMVNNPLGIWLTKQTLWHNQNAGSLEAAIEMENRAVFMAQSTEDAKEKRASSFEKRTPVFHYK